MMAAPPPAPGQAARQAPAGLPARGLLLSGILLLAFLCVFLEGLARYLEHRVRARVSEALGYATMVKAGITIYYETHGELPERLAEIEMYAPQERHSLQQVAWRPERPLGGELQLYFAAAGGGIEPGDLLVYRARIDQYGRVRWRCDRTAGAGRLPPRYRTPGCIE